LIILTIKNKKAMKKETNLLDPAYARNLVVGWSKKEMEFNKLAKIEKIAVL